MKIQARQFKQKALRSEFSTGTYFVPCVQGDEEIQEQYTFHRKVNITVSGHPFRVKLFPAWLDPVKVKHRLATERLLCDKLQYAQHNFLLQGSENY